MYENNIISIISNKSPENAEYKLSTTPLWEITPNQIVKDNSVRKKTAKSSVQAAN